LQIGFLDKESKAEFLDKEAMLFCFASVATSNKEEMDVVLFCEYCSNKK